MKPAGKGWAWLALSTVLTALVYVLPQLFAFSQGYTEAYLLKPDEPYYAARVVRFLQGRFWIGDQWSYELRDFPNLIPPLPEWVIGSLAKVLGLKAGGAVVLSRVIFPPLTVTLLAFALRLAGLPMFLASVSAFILVCDPGVFYYKIFIHAFMPLSEHPFNRFSNPIFGMSLFFLGWLLAYRALLNNKFDKKTTIAAGVALGLLFYVSIYYWTHLALSILLCVLFVRHPARWKILSVGALTAFVVSIPYCLHALRMRSHPEYQWIAWRIGLLIKDRGEYLLQHKAMLAATVLCLPLWFTGRKEHKYWLLGIMGGAVCYFSTLVTHISLQNFHWQYTLAPMTVAGVLILIGVVSGKRNHRLTIALGLIAMVASLISAARSTYSEFQLVERSPKSQHGASDFEYREAWKWLEQNAAPDSVVLSSAKIQFFVPVRSGLRAWMVAATEPVSFEEMLARWQLLWFCSSASEAELTEILVPQGSVSVPQWIFGLTRAQKLALDSKGRPAFDLGQSIQIGRELVKTQTQSTAAQIAAQTRSLRLDYVLRGPYEAKWGKTCGAVLRTQTVWERGNLRIDRVISRKH